MSGKKNRNRDKIISELNANMKKESTEQGTQKTSGSQSADRKSASSKEERKSAGRQEEQQQSFLNTSIVIEEPQPEEPHRPAVRHIAVTAAEELAEEPLPKSGLEIERESMAGTRRKSRADSAGEVKKQASANPPAQMPKRRRKRMSRREKKTIILGVFVSFFVIVGCISTVMTGVDLTYNLINNTSRKDELARAIFPLVIVDIPEFDTPEALDNSAIIQSAIWAFIIDEEDKSKYPKDDLGAMTVPDADIEPYIRHLYGNDVEIRHQSIEDASVQMIYAPDSKKYIIESTPKFLPYTPRVDKIVKKEDVYTLTVSYVLPDALWNLKKDHSDAVVDKVMEYRLKQTNDGYRMLSVKLLEVTGRVDQSSGSDWSDFDSTDADTSDWQQTSTDGAELNQEQLPADGTASTDVDIGADADISADEGNDAVGAQASGENDNARAVV